MITGYVGGLGHGKTMLAVKEAARIARVRRVPVLSNIAFTAPGVEGIQVPVGQDGLELPTPDAWAASHPGQGRVVLIDEIGIITPARFWQTGMSIDLMYTASQSRKNATDIVFTAQNIDQVDKFLRDLTEFVTLVRAVPRPTIERREAGKRPWFIVCTRWRTTKVNTEGGRLGRGVVRYRRAVESWYNTDELVRPPEHLRGKRARGASPARERVNLAMGGPGADDGAGVPGAAGVDSSAEPGGTVAWLTRGPDDQATDRRGVRSAARLPETGRSWVPDPTNG